MKSPTNGLHQRAMRNDLARQFPITRKLVTTVPEGNAGFPGKFARFPFDETIGKSIFAQKLAILLNNPNEKRPSFRKTQNFWIELRVDFPKSSRPNRDTS
ncbi:MAG: hypothetical protein V4733_02675 [Verrucomicrobiota bacterium]